MRVTRMSGAPLVLAFGLLFACPAPEAEDKAANPESAAKPPEPESKDSGVDLPPGTGPVAKVNDQEIARELFNREYTQTIERYLRAKHDVKPALRERLKDNIVRRLVDAEIIRQQAKKLNVELAAEELESKWLEHKKRYGSEDAFQAFLERAGTSAEDVRRQFSENLLREKVFAAVATDVAIDAKEVREYYDKNKQRYDKPEQIKASHILIRVPPNAAEPEKKERRARAEEALKAAKAKGADFAEVAKKYGEDPTRDRGGDLGLFARGRMVKPFEDVAWKLKVGQISGIVETQFGFHVIKKTDHQKPHTVPFKDVQESIERSLEARKRNQMIRDSLANWKKEAKIEIFVQGDPKVIADERTAPTGLLRPTGGPQVNPTMLKDPKAVVPSTIEAKPKKAE